MGERQKFDRRSFYPASPEIYHSLLDRHKVSLVQTGNYPRAGGDNRRTARFWFARVESMTYSCAFSQKRANVESRWQYT
jgi:hypothetical protein